MTITELLAIARAATPGPWETYGSHLVYSRGENTANICGASEPRATAHVEYTRPEIGSDALHEVYANARHIAAMHPARVIALLEFVEAWDQWHDAVDSDDPGAPDEGYEECVKKRRALEEVT